MVNFDHVDELNRVLVVVFTSMVSLDNKYIFVILRLLGFIYKCISRLIHGVKSDLQVRAYIYVLNPCMKK